MAVYNILPKIMCKMFEVNHPVSVSFVFAYKKLPNKDAINIINNTFVSPITYERSKNKIVDTSKDDEIAKRMALEYGTMYTPDELAKLQEINLDDWVEEPEECLICTENLPIGVETTILDCKHKFHATCLDKWSEYKSGDFFSMNKHKCPICRNGIIPLNISNPYHKPLLDTNTLWLKPQYQVEETIGNDGKKIPQSLYRFCLCFTTQCGELFDAGTAACGDIDRLHKFCLKCDPQKRQKECPTCKTMIVWESGCQRIFCNVCRTHFCFLHQRSEESIKKEMQEIYAQGDPDKLFEKYKNKRWAISDIAAYIQLPIETSSNATANNFVYHCTDCARENMLYG